MPNTTPNLGLIKPLVTEQYDIAKVTNENADKIDLLLAPKDNPTFTGITTAPSIVTNGIKFPAVQVPSADPNILDDYKEGTWTPTLGSNTGTSPTVTYTLQFGRYTKIGRLVFCYLTINGTITVGGASNLTCTLPFLSVSDVSTWQHSRVGYADSTAQILVTGIAPMTNVSTCALFSGTYADVFIPSMTGRINFSTAFTYITT